MTTDRDGGAVYVTLHEAAARAGVSISALRKWYQSGVIPSDLRAGAHGPQRYVELQAVLDRTQSFRAAQAERLAQKGEGMSSSTVAVVSQVAAMARELADAKEQAGRADVLERELAEAKAHIARLEARVGETISLVG